MEKNFYKRNVVISWSRTAMLICAIFWGSLANADNAKAHLQPERLENYLKKIEQAYKLSFVYGATEISKTMILDVPAKLTSVQESLDYLNQKNITYSRVGNQVFLKLQVERSPEQAITVSGRVRDKKDNSAMPGVSVREVGARNSISTNQQGEYKITVKDGAKVSFSFIGYKTVEVAVNGRTNIDVSLEEDANQLKEVNIVSTGYQTIKKESLTGSVSKVKAADINVASMGTLDKMLQGQVAGVAIETSSAVFGTAPKIRVRGSASLSGVNEPLWVLDGVPLESPLRIAPSELYSGGARNLLASALSGVNPEDIEDITVLKDATATAMYGTRAVNGVIVITTKRAKKNMPLIINYSTNATVTLKPSINDFDVLNSKDQTLLNEEIFRTY